MARALCAVAVAAGATVAQQARADVIFNYSPGAVTPGGTPGGAIGPGQIVITDEAYAKGFTAIQDIRSGQVVQRQVEGLRGLSFSFGRGPVGTTFDLGFLSQTTLNLAPGITSFFSISVTPGGLPTGIVSLLGGPNIITSFDVVLSGATATGTYSIELGGCERPNGTLGPCSTIYTVTQAVPEPASLALFGAGLLGLGLVRRRRG